MKRLIIALLSLSIITGIVGCATSDKEGLSSTASIAEPSHALGLLASKEDASVVSSEPEQIVDSSVTTEVTSSEEVETQTSSEVDSVASNTSSKKDKWANATVKPSDIKNPTGIVSVDRKNNNGKDWQLTLVNPWNTLHTSYQVQTAEIDSRFGAGKLFDARAVDDLNAMCEAALEDGVSLSVISAHRTYDYQQMLYSNEVAEYRLYNPGCTEEEALKGAATEVARPGTSEHNLGLAVDFNSVEQSFESTEAFKWLQKHSTEYGFILRYSPSTQDITGVIYEPWHYRYVGKENAKKIKESGLTLEEYVKKNS